jgi:hypothetical protein
MQVRNIKGLQKLQGFSSTLKLVFGQLNATWSVVARQSLQQGIGYGSDGQIYAV